jgi:(1->4)-alpha-D-glucan 1-alpha-D-glucosylmutase
MSRGAPGKIPSSTYRLQLRAGVDLGRARELVAYLAELGAGWLYLSPVFLARAGSPHGYDVVDSTKVDPELGTLEELGALAQELHGERMGLLLDVVPNHMTAHVDNPWWRDLLQHGRASSHADYFDIRWSNDPEGRLVLPLLGRHYGAALEAGELVPDYDEDGFVIRYHEHTLPLDPRSWGFILERVAERLPGREDVAQLVATCLELPPHTDPGAQRVRSQTSERLRASLRMLLGRNGELRAAIDAVIRELAGEPGHPRSFDRLHQLLEEQAYRITYWRSGLGEINYRRFFDITELVALRAEREEVFDATHRLVLDLVRRGWADGLRIDHVDGLADPAGYLRRLCDAGVPYLIVEKILLDGETLRRTWPCDGTTGYEFIAASLPLFVDPAGWERIDAAYRAERPGLESFDACVRVCKKKVIDELFAPALQNLASDLRSLSMYDRSARDVSQAELETALRAITVALPVYRTYRVEDELDSQDERVLGRALEIAREEIGDADRCALDFVVRLLLGQLHGPAQAHDAEHAFVRRWQQLTGAVMAKGLEDTALYRYVPLVALNEVGTHPQLVADPLQAFHDFCGQKREQGGTGLLVTATHDTKRGEDVRARLCALSELDDEWHGCRTRCSRALRQIDPDIDEEAVELLLQTFVGAWPLDDAAREQFRPRLHEYMIKAAREAKRSTSWLRPDPTAEGRITVAVNALLDGLGETWGRSLAELAQRVAFVGAINALSQTLVKLASPGVADVYQGTELWDFSLVDPDNRRPVDFDLRRRVLADLRRKFEEDPVQLCAELRESWRDGRVKMFVVWRGLQARAHAPALWVEGSHVPLKVEDGSDDQICAFARCHGERWGVAVAARRLGARLAPEAWPLGKPAWSSSTIRLPAGAPRRWRDQLTGRELASDDGCLHLEELFEHLPVALLTS